MGYSIHGGGSTSELKDVTGMGTGARSFPDLNVKIRKPGEY